MNKYSTIAVLVSLAVLTSSAAAFDWTSTTESAHQHKWNVPNMGLRIDHQFELARNSMMERRAKYGLYIPKASMTADFDLNGLLGTMLGFSYGLQYDPKKPGICYQSIESTALEMDNILAALEKIYIPSRWADMVLGFQNWIQLSTGVYANCDTQKLFNTVTALFTGEGTSTLMARLGGGFIFELPGYLEDLTNMSGSDFKRGNAFGKIVQLAFNYSIN